MMALPLPSLHADEAAALTLLHQHGAMLLAELHSCGYTQAEIEVADSPFLRVDTLIGPLYFQRERKRTPLSDGERTSTGRTSGAAIDSAYVRLFMRRTGGEWKVPSNGKLGTFHEDMERYPLVTIRGAVYNVSGKVLGNGVTPRLIRMYLLSNRSAYARLKRRLMVITPRALRMTKVSLSFSDVLTITEYTDDQARGDNLAAFITETQELT